MALMTPNQQTLMTRIAQLCAELPGVSAVALGGSFARGRARPDSDIDIGLYYRAGEPIDIDRLKVIAASLNDSPSPVVAGLGDWGRWVNGGAWLTIEGQRVDLLYRCIDDIEACWIDAQNGRFELDYGQQPPFGFFGPTLLGEVAIAQPLADPSGVLTALKAQVTPYPDVLRRAVVQQSLWDADFSLRAFAPKFVQRGDAWGALSCFSRIIHRLILTLFALNRVWLINDKTALDEIRDFSQAPLNFSDRANAMMAKAGAEPETLARSLVRARVLFEHTAKCAEYLYAPSWNF